MEVSTCDEDILIDVEVAASMRVPGPRCRTHRIGNFLGARTLASPHEISDTSNNKLEKRAINYSKLFKDVINALRRKMGEPHYRLKWNVSSDSVVQGSGLSLVTSPSTFPTLPQSLCISTRILVVIPPLNVGAVPGCSDEGKVYVRMTRSNCRTFKPAPQAGQATTRAEKVLLPPNQSRLLISASGECKMDGSSLMIR
jgi:hypothetical protein